MTRLLLPALLAAASLQAQSLLPGTQPLEPNTDFSATMVAGIDKMALRLIEQSKATRKPDREKLKAILGLVDQRLPITALELLGTTTTPALLAETATARIYRVRWPVFEGVHGEGIYIQPKTKPIARIIMLPDVDESLPEDFFSSFAGSPPVEAVVMALIDNASAFSTNEKYGIKTNIPHREWIYRQSFELGRHIIGYEVQKALSLVDWFKAKPDQAPLIITGRGRAGLWHCALRQSMRESTQLRSVVISARGKKSGRSGSVEMCLVCCVILVMLRWLRLFRHDRSHFVTLATTNGKGLQRRPQVFARSLLPI